jgi:hypothetical protein
METITEVKERPILFSTPMVKAILEGRKTVTRRIVDIDPELAKHVTKWGYSIFTAEGCISARTKQPTTHGHRYGEKWIKMKYGKPGDILWVRETWSKIHYEGVDEKPTYIFKTDDVGAVKHIWKPSIHMPRVACRLRLEIQSVRVERLHDITEEDAVREGVEWMRTGWKDYLKDGVWFDAKSSFNSLWQSINGAESWNTNPWVWRIEFKKV